MATTRQNRQRPLIGVTGNAKYWSPSWVALSNILRCCGARAKRISVRHSANINRLDALIISGGDDIHPSLYGEQEMPKAKYDQPRDELEIHYIRYALERHLPMLGICRGYQLLNVVCGGTLYDDIRPMRQKTSNFNTILPRKTAYLAKPSQLYQLMNQPKIQINSLHHQAICQVAPEFSIAATDKDKFIQAIEHMNHHTMLGVQWHPEYLFYRHSQRQLFHWLIAQAKLYRGDQ
ncbi:gamma-glutamyl-gamma-aminobutyrate hydrolase family protein [Celerinatantimonas sp. MCCC 1A17872]|uniref:gamma-glutamyl-gamma-aminobutyrate hydrolase family protein n=1 Tax=Celerinatantimonas sp. MCCC 1A17872 TaxID=3177514 RepID=UPI0038C52E89